MLAFELTGTVRNRITNKCFLYFPAIFFESEYCMECGQPITSLKVHLNNFHGDVFHLNTFKSQTAPAVSF